MDNKKRKQYRERAEQTAQKQRDIQKRMEEIDKKQQSDSTGETSSGKKEVQAGERDQPESQMPEQHLKNRAVKRTLTSNRNIWRPIIKVRES